MDKTLIKNIASLLGIQGMNYIIPLITLPYLVRTLGPVGYGSLGFSLAIIQYFCLLTDYGFNLSVTRQIAVIKDNKNKVSELFWNILSCKLILAILSLIILCFATVLSKQLQNILPVVVSAYGMVLGNVLFPSWLFQGKESMGWIAIANIAARLSAVPLIFIFVNSSTDVWVAAFITGITSIIAGIIGLWFIYRQEWICWCGPNWDRICLEFRKGWHIFLSTAAISLYTTSTTVILGFIAGPVAVGFYVAADKLRLAVQGLIGPVSQALYPRINATMAKDKEKAFSIIRKLLKWQVSFTFLLSIGLFFGASSVIDIVYGENYYPSVSVLYWLAWLPVIIGLSNVFGVQTLLVLGLNSLFSRILICAGIVNLLLLVPLAIFLAEEGAAISVFVTEILVTFSMFLVILNKKIPLFSKGL